MKWFLNISTRAKLLLGISSVLALMVLIGLVTYFGLIALLDGQRHLSENEIPELLAAATLNANQNELRVIFLMVVTSANREEINRLTESFENLTQENNSLAAQLIEFNRSDAEGTRILNEIQEIRKASHETRRQIIQLALEGQLEEAKALTLGIQQERFETIYSLMQGLMRNATREAQLTMERSQARVNRMLITSGIVAVAALVLGLGLVGYFTRAIANPLVHLSRAADLIAKGDLTSEIKVEQRGDEIGALHKAFGNMVAGLRDLTRQLREGTNVIAASATQILTASTEMATSATETATAVSQTTATVEEVKQTAQVSKDKARYVADIAQRAADGSEDGRKAVEISVEGTNRIRAQMEAIAESIVRLSEQSQAIGEIISSVNDLAEQSNLLAVNAAIEAAKAGEQGKGFAVVAQEIRNLAAQSKQATAQVRSILGDIQKATSSAVMATEQGSKAVDAGVQQTAQAGETIRLLADSITEAAEAAVQISASHEQQSIGMVQVAQAMENIKQAAQQNANATRQVESGTRDLHELGQKLQQLAARFRTEGS
jgi:methyl-accepting chemotaxis protein